jgi:predicted DNA-binding protein with PD1-like motif
MQSVVEAKLGRIIYAQFEPDEDVYRGLVNLITEEKLHTGIILSITGGLHKVRLSMPRKPDTKEISPGFIELEGSTEAQGNGYFGWTEETWFNDSSQIRHNAGEPFLHCHMTVSNGGQTYMGHLIDGCKVRSLHPQSHFVAVIAEAEGVQLTFHCSQETTEQYPHGLPYYKLVAAGGNGR